jgi:hypothetical protein
VEGLAELLFDAESDANVDLEARVKSEFSLLLKLTSSRGVSTTTRASHLRHFGMAEAPGNWVCGAAQKGRTEVQVNH